MNETCHTCGEPIADSLHLVIDLRGGDRRTFHNQCWLNREDQLDEVSEEDCF